MTRAAIVLLLALIAVPVVAEDPRVEKQRLIAELIEIIDAKRLTQASFEVLLGNVERASMEHADEETKELIRKQREQMEAFRDRLYTRIDYAKLADEVYAPMFDKHFTAAELKDLIAFLKTKPGQKLVAMLPELGVGGFMQSSAIFQQAAELTSDEMEKEANAKMPWRATMADMRTIAVALEARATDVNEYPANVGFDDLEPIVSPTYIKTLPKADAWGTPFLYVGDKEHYRIVSAGADKRFEWNARQLTDRDGEPRLMDDLDADIIFTDGVFIQMPKVAQQEQ